MPKNHQRGRRSTVVVCLVVAGCSSTHVSTTARYIDQLPCSADGAPTIPTSRQAIHAEGFPAVSALLCGYRFDIDAARRASSAAPGAATGVYWRQSSVQRSTGPFDDLVRALRTAPETPDGDVVCTADLVAPIAVTLTDATGHTVAPAIPADPCGHPSSQVKQAISALTWTPIGPT